MAHRRRPDGFVVADAPGHRRFMPALMPTRNGSVVHFDQRFRVEGTERYLAEVTSTTLPRTASIVPAEPER